MDYDRLWKFVHDNDTVKVFSSGKERRLRSGDSDSFDLIEKAERFEFDGKSYTKDEFEKLVEKEQRQQR